MQVTPTRGVRRGAPGVVARRSRATAGFTLIEVMVALGVMAVGLALASRLLIESQLGLVRTSAELGNPLPRYALARLRSDLEQATDLETRSLPALLPVWQSLPLILRLSSGDRIAWAADAEAIVRVILDDDGQVLVRHVVLRDVAQWRWRRADDRLIDVEITYRARDTSRVPLADVARTWSPPTVDRVVWLRVGARADWGAP